MSTSHPTRRDFILILVVTLLLGLFLQFDLSLRFTDSTGSDSLFGVKLGFGGRRGDGWEDDDRPATGLRGSDRWLEDVKTGVKSSPQGGGMAEAKIRWGEEGAVRTEVLAHAPGRSLAGLKGKSS